MRPRRGARLRRRCRPRLLCGGSVRRGRARLRRRCRRGVARLRRLLRTSVRRWLGRRSRRFFGSRRFFRWRRRLRRWWRGRRRRRGLRRRRRRRRGWRFGGRVWRRSGRLGRRVRGGRLRIFLGPGGRCEQRECQRGDGRSSASRQSLQTMYRGIAGHEARDDTLPRRLAIARGLPAPGGFLSEVGAVPVRRRLARERPFHAEPRSRIVAAILFRVRRRLVLRRAGRTQRDGRPPTR